MTLITILLVGDEPNILRTLRRNLVSRGYDVLLALDDIEAYDQASKIEPDLFILNTDFDAVQVDGLAICEQIRKISHAPIIILSAVGEESTKIRALDLGADDYLVMPFNMEEFLARVRVALRRWMSYKMGPVVQEKLTLAGELLINSDARQVTVRGKDVHLTPTEFDILQYLADRMGKVVGHRELLKAVWGDVYGDEREYLRVFISQLRRKIEDDPVRPVYIQTVPGVGYRFSPDSKSNLQSEIAI
ncbi:MAG TPA: response regulator transcription factor [Anaerolineales bacterium]|nr:response regulator transcription factor [Anaerolineales bacterium]